MSTKTIAELATIYKLPKNEIKISNTGSPLVYEMLRSSTLKVDDAYQRLLSSLAIKTYGSLKRSRLHCSVVSRRPKSCGDFAGDYIIDGQHKGIMHHLSGIENVNNVESLLPCQVMIWPEGMTIDQIREKEAELFIDLNTLSKKLTKVDEYRAGAFINDSEAVRVLNYMIALNIEIDNFGSKEDDAYKLKTHNPFFYTILQDIPDNSFGQNKALSALKLYETIYPTIKNKTTKSVHGQVFRTMYLLWDFVERGLTNGKQKLFKDWLYNGKFQNYTQSTLIKNHGNFAGPRYILHDRIISAFNTYQTNKVGKGAQTIGTETISTAKNIDKKFGHPEDDG